MTPQKIISEARAAGRTVLTEAAGKDILDQFGLTVPRGVVVSGARDVGAAHGLKPPLVVKVISQDIVHKTDIGGVVLNLDSVEQAQAAISEIAKRPQIADARIDGFLVEEMAPQGTEIVIGGLLDQQFGPMMMVGLGGIFVEVLRDTAFRLCPISKDDAQLMLQELRGAAILRGVRGIPAVPMDMIIELLLRIGGKDGLLMELGSEIAELDLNPVIVKADGPVVVDARFILASDSDYAAQTNGDDLPGKTSVRERFAALFQPKTVAVLGASSRATTVANTFIRRMKEFGYPGQIYPIHPKSDTVEGLTAYPSLADTPEPIDYAYVAVGAESIPEILAAADGNLCFAQVISSGFAEVKEGQHLEKQLVQSARKGGCRIVGPNCLGLYSPRGGVTFPEGAPKDTGSVGVVTQSGGLGTDVIKRGQWRGVRFSGLVTAGNCADIKPHELLAFFLEDPETKVVGLYLEDVKNGRRFFDLLRSEKATKPVIILRGGRSAQGQAAAASHTGALAGRGQAWDALAAQTGCVLVRTVDEFVDTLLAFQLLLPSALKQTQYVALFGNGGGISVLATDSFADYGLEVRAFGSEPRKRLEALNLPPGTSLANPVDTPVRTLQEKNGAVAAEILDIVNETAKPDAIVVHLNLAAFRGRGDHDPVDNLVDNIVGAKSTKSCKSHLVMVLRVDGSPELDARKRACRERILASGIPVYDELANAAQALSAISTFERYQSMCRG